MSSQDSDGDGAGSCGPSAVGGEVSDSQRTLVMSAREPETTSPRQSRAVLDAPGSKLGVTIRLWIDKLAASSPSLHLEWLQGWRALEKFLDGKPLKVALN